MMDDLDALEAHCVDSVAAWRWWMRRAPNPRVTVNGEELLALITRLRAAEARTAWQPIETAPRDCCVIGWADEWARPDVAWYCAGGWWSGCGSPCPEITHWQPLPAPPASEVTRG